MPNQSGALQISPVWRPSTARRVMLDGYYPVPRGGSGATASTLSWPAKDPAEVLDYEIDIAAAIAGNEGDALADVSIAITPNAIGDLSVNSVATDGATAVLWLSAGAAGTTYVVQVTISTKSGRVLHRSILLPVQSLASTTVPTSVLTTNSGAVITDQSGNPILLGS